MRERYFATDAGFIETDDVKYCCSCVKNKQQQQKLKKSNNNHLTKITMMRIFVSKVCMFNVAKM